MKKTKSRGDAGEKFITENIPCPNCNKSLQALPRNYPLYDVQCTGCVFRAQVKTVHAKPKNTVLGAGWEIMNKVLKSGYLVPPLIVQFIWREKGRLKRLIRFHPFVPKSNLKNYQLLKSGYAMFVYSDVLNLPGFVFEQHKWQAAPSGATAEASANPVEKERGKPEGTRIEPALRRQRQKSLPSRPSIRQRPDR